MEYYSLIVIKPFRSVLFGTFINEPSDVDIELLKRPSSLNTPILLLIEIISPDLNIGIIYMMRVLPKLASISLKINENERI